MPAPVIIIGGLLSPYVRKVLAVCDLKRVPYLVDPIVPFTGDDRFDAVSPLRRVPVLIDDAVTLSDSSVICQYLEDRYPSPPLYPTDIADRAQARWLEEYADTRMGDVIMWKIFNEACIKPAIWRQPRDTAAIARAVTDDLPVTLDYLETIAPRDGFVFGPLSIADIAISVFFRNLRWSRVEPDAGRWPGVVAWIDRATSHPVLRRLAEAADHVLRLPPADTRAAMPGLGFPVTAETMGTAAPRRGPLTV